MNPTEPKAAEWFCVRCQTKREHIAAGHLREIENVEVFCPRLRYRKATRRGKIWWVEPMFPGYLLAKFNISEMERAVTFCQGVRGLVRFGSEIPPVPESFVEAIKREIRNRKDATEDELVTLSPMIEIGDEVEVAHGPFQGMQGTVVTVPSATERVKILLEFLGKPHAVDMDLFSILLPGDPLPEIKRLPRDHVTYFDRFPLNTLRRHPLSALSSIPIRPPGFPPLRKDRPRAAA